MVADLMGLKSVHAPMVALSVASQIVDALTFIGGSLGGNMNMDPESLRIIYNL